MHLQNQDIVKLTERGEMVAAGIAREPSHGAGDDILGYLAGGNLASVEELGMTLKILWDDLKSELERLSEAGYVKVRTVDIAGVERERVRRMKMTPDERDREDAQQESLWRHKHGPADSYRGGMPPHECLE